MRKSIAFAEFKDDAALLKAATELKRKGIKLYDAFSPFPIHGIDEVLDEKRSRLPIVCFIAASMGCLGAMYFQYWSSSVDWPINVGGKPFFSIPAFLPVTFEVTVLSGGLISVFAFFVRSQLFPGKGLKMPHPNVTDDGFWIGVHHEAAKLDFKALENLLSELGGKTVHTEEYE